MNRRTLAAAVFLALSFLDIEPAAAQALKIRVGTEGTYRPMSYFDTAGKLTDESRAVARRRHSIHTDATFAVSLRAAAQTDQQTVRHRL